tara:strand:- start:1288 stop:1401 length:114 start_codon:yes stop_codon:yes gene_type:complete
MKIALKAGISVQDDSYLKLVAKDQYLKDGGLCHYELL